MADDDFTKWFGRGAVSDNEGPLTVYHGTTQGDENTGEVIENFLAMNCPNHPFLCLAYAIPYFNQPGYPREDALAL